MLTVTLVFIFHHYVWYLRTCICCLKPSCQCIITTLSQSQYSRKHPKYSILKTHSTHTHTHAMLIKLLRILIYQYSNFLSTQIRIISLLKRCAYLYMHQIRSVTQLCLTLWRPHESQHARPPCPSPTPGVH